MNVKTVSFRSPNASKEFVQSLRETGFAVLSDHPIPAATMNAAYQGWEKFFHSEGKQKYLFDPEKQAGFFPFRTENAKDSKVKDLKEFYHYYPWGELPPEAKASSMALYESLMSMGAEMLTWIQKDAPTEVTAQFPSPLIDMIRGTQNALLRAIHYPPLSGTEEEGAIRAAAHEDINLITLLPAATAPGLQVKDTAGNWHDVSCDPGTIVVNAGDMLKEASGGYFPSTTHQVVNPRGPESRNPRYSLPFFLHPRSDARLSSRYIAGEYLKERLEEIGLIKKKNEG